MKPFIYPETPHSRRHAPEGYDDYSSFKPWLRDEFVFRCVYCLVQERWLPNGHSFFVVEHFKPKSVHRKLECSYPNLLYACQRCNLAKGDNELPDELQPECLPYGRRMAVKSTGEIVGLDAQGNHVAPRGKVALLIAGLRLNCPRLVEYRRAQMDRWRREAPTIEKNLSKCGRFELPVDMPDLSQSRPAQNERPDGVRTQYRTRVGGA